MASPENEKALVALRIVESVIALGHGRTVKRPLDRSLAVDAGLQLGQRLVDMADGDEVEGVLEGLQRALISTETVRAHQKVASRGLALKQRLVKTGELLPAAEVHRRGGPTPQALHKGQATGRYFALTAGGREQYYPAFFADRHLTDNGLFRVLGVLKHESPWAKWTFLTTRSAGLGGRTPLDALRKGEDLGKVLGLAKASIER